MMNNLVRAGLAFVVLFSAAAYLTAAQESTKKVEKGPMPATSPASGKEMFNSYCAACHGKAAKGDGPAASALKTPPSDLTQLSRKNGGKFPADHVSSTLRSGATSAHGSTDMPVWGPLFTKVSGSSDAIAQMRLANVVKYLESLQAR